MEGEHLAQRVHRRVGALLVRRWDGLNWAVLFNTDGGAKSLVGGIDPLVHEAADKVKEWPRTDLFEKV